MAIQVPRRSSADAAEIVALVEAYVGSLFDYLPSALVLSDAAGRIVRANGRAERLLGRRDLQGLPIRSVLPFVDGPTNAEMWVGLVPGRHGLSLRVRSAHLACPPAGAVIYTLEQEWPHRAVGSVVPLRSRFAPSRVARL